MYSPRGVAFGASYADIHAQAPAYRVLMFGALLGAGISLFSLALRSFRFIGYSVLGLVALSLAVGYAYPAFMQQFTVSPNELAYELPFIEHNINFTREAFDIDDIQSSPFAAENDITQADLNENAATIQNFRLWDYRVLKDTYTQMQEIRMYYSFHDVDVERYEVGGQTRLVLSSPRELDIRSLPAEATSWVNLHLKYTHGYGMVMSPASEVTRDGAPSFYLMDIPPKSTTDQGGKTEPYFGEPSNHIVVNTKEPEFDYPRMDTETCSTFYQAREFWWLHSQSTGLHAALPRPDIGLGAITPESRLIMTRNMESATIFRSSCTTPTRTSSRLTTYVLDDRRVHGDCQLPLQPAGRHFGREYIRNSRL